MSEPNNAFDANDGPDDASQPVEEEYAVKEVLVEQNFTETDENGVELGKRWLVWWDGYGLDECTWEPRHHLVTDEANVLEGFYDKRREMGARKFDEWQQKNLREYEQAIREADAAGQQETGEDPEAEREKADAEMTKPPTRRTRRAVITDSDDEEDVPLRLSRPINQQQPVAPKATLTTKEPSSVKSPKAMAPAKPTNGELFIRQPPTVTIAKSATKPSQTRPPRSNVTSTADEQRRGLVTQNSAAASGKTQMPAGPTVDTPASTQRRASNIAGASRVASTTPTTTTRAGPSPVSQSVELPGPARTGSGAGVTTPINIVNEPKPVQKEWKNSTQLYGRLRSRWNAQKRSVREGTPDMRALDFVNTPPPDFATSRPRAAADNPYGRREVRQPRVQEDSMGSDRDTASRRSMGAATSSYAFPDAASPAQGSTDATIPLQSWEADKVPLVCYDWRLSNNCIHGAEKCRFMHRNQDPQGRNYELSDSEGRVPAKYQRPPLTCLYWLRGERGCFKSDKECPYAHWNTGWLLPPDIKVREPTKIDLQEVPRSETNTHESTQPSNKKTKRPSHELTCWYWAKGICRNKAENCAFQHWDTGKRAGAPPGALVCKEWSERGNCTRANCQYQHQQTQFGNFSGTSNVPTRSAFQDEKSRQLSTQMNDVEPEHVDGLAGSSPPTPTEEPLRQALPPPPSLPPTPRLTCMELDAQIARCCKLDFDEIFVGGDDGKNAIDRRAFLIYHSKDHAEEIELLTRWLMMHHVEVGNTWIDGAWDGFRKHVAKGGPGVIIAHTDIEYFTAIAGLGEVLRQKQVKLWSVGIQEGNEYDPTISDDPPVIRRACIEIFPLGGLIYITDEVFETRPQLALKIIELFFAKIAKLKQLDGPLSPWQEVDDAPLLWRLCVRPELMEYLFQNCETHTMELLVKDSDAQSQAQLYTLLSETNYIEQDDPVTPITLTSDYFPILSERRVIAEVEPVDYSNTLARSQEQANLHMIRYYAGMQVDMRRDYRHFFVVHTEPEAPYVQKWKDEIQTIGAVITPEQCVEEFRKSSEESMFDFCERFMEKKREGDSGET